MNFLHLWALGLGACALAIPVAVHFLTKPRPVTYPLATIRFLREVIEEKRSRSRLRDLLVLLLRMLAVGLLAMALARPWINNSQAIEAIPDDTTARVIVIDVSQSMSAKAAGTTSISQAQSIALKYLEYSPNLQANVILVGAKARPTFKSVSSNLAILREAVRSASPRCEKADVKSSMNIIGTMLSELTAAKTELIVISDFQRSNWSNLFLDAIPTATKVQLESVSIETVSNVAITGFRISGRAIVESDIILEFDVANYSDQAVEVQINVDLGGIQKTINGKVIAQSVETLTAPMKFSRPQWVVGWVQLQGNNDAIPADDARPIAFRIDQPPKVIVITKSTGKKEAMSSFFLRQALDVISGPSLSDEKQNSPANQVRTLDPDNVNAEKLSEADIFMVHRSGALERSVVDAIASRVRKGKGLLYIAGEQVDAVNLDLFATAMGSGYQPPVQLVPPDNDTKRKDLFVRDVRFRQPPFDVFGEQASSAMQTTRIGGGLASRALESGLRDQVVAELSDSSALLFMTSCDAGTVAVLNADLDESNWCSQPSFFPVFNELISAVYSNRNSSPEASGGEPLIRQLSSTIPETASLVAESADKRSAMAESFGSWEWNAAQNSFVWAWPDPIGPGIYQLLYKREPAVATAIAAPAVESDPKTLSAELLKGRLAGNRFVTFRDAKSADQKSDHWWNWLIIACILGLASEIVTLRWFSA
jgi:Aerotolerance regulator N-terminal/von Willebrand factor type A domain